MKIYRDREPSGDYFRLAYYLGGKRHRLCFSSLDAARTEASAKAAQLARGDADAVQFNGKDRLTYGRALDAIRPTGAELDTAATEYAQAARILAGHSLIEAASFYMRQHANQVAARMVADAVEDFRQAKIAAGRSAVYLKDIRYRMSGFAKAFNVEVRALVAQDVAADYFDELKLHPRNFNNQLSMLRTFFGFCQARGCADRAFIRGIASASRRHDARRGELVLNGAIARQDTVFKWVRQEIKRLERQGV